MDNFIGAIRFTLSASNTIQLIWCGLTLLFILILAILHHRWRYDHIGLKKWRKLCCIPFFAGIVHYFIYVWGVSDIPSSYTPFYLITLLPLILIPCAERNTGYSIFAPITWVLALVMGIRFCILPTELHNFARKSYTDSFHALVKEMDRSYVLKEWKEIDFPSLEEKYMPMVREAEQQKDPAKFADAVTMFCNELHDGHISVHSDYDDKKYRSALELRDYGLSMIQLDSGEVIAVCTAEEANRLGISDGTVITEWNGKPVLQAAAEDVADDGISVKANADRLALPLLSGTGGDSVEVTFIGSSGKEQTVTLSALEEEHTLGDVYSAFTRDRGSFGELYSSNFSTRMLDDKCGYLMFCAATTGSSLRDDLAFYSGDCKWAREKFRSGLRSLRAQGMEYLVIDLRNNIGGTDEVGGALCSLLTDEEQYAVSFGTRKKGEYIRISDDRIKSDGEFADIQAVALTNFNCVSAGDATASYLSKLPNVTLAGITDPNGSGQITGGCCVLSKGIVVVNYPVCLTLDENGEPFADPRADRISRDPAEVRIPLDYDAAMKIFHDKEDYELEWAVDYLENNGTKNVNQE